VTRLIRRHLGSAAARRRITGSPQAPMVALREPRVA
jgi:hypothetical protein